MSTQIYSPFLTLAYLKYSLNKSDTTTFDDKITEILDRSNEEVDNKIHPYITTPVDEGDDIFPACRTAALRFAKAIWADEQLNDMDKLKVYTELYETKIESIIKELKSTRNVKTKTVLIRSDPRDAKVIIPTLADNFIFDDY